MSEWSNEAGSPVTLFADPGQQVSLRSLLERGYGPDAVNDLMGHRGSIAIAYQNAPSYTPNSYWDPSHPSPTQVLRDGVPLDAVRNVNTDWATIDIADIDRITLRAGNLIYSNVQIAVDTSADPRWDQSYQHLTLTTVAKQFESASAYDGLTDPSDVVAMAHRFAATYGGVVNANDCHYIANAIASAAGASLPPNSGDPVHPQNNEEGGYWRVVHRGSDNPVSNWESLVQPGDIVRMGWAGGGQHTITVTAGLDAGGQIRVVDNTLRSNGQSVISEHWVDFDGALTNPGSITIYRLSPDHLNLINGSPYGDVLHGTVHDDLFKGYGMADYFHGGRGDDTYVLESGQGQVGSSNFFYDTPIEKPGEGIDTVMVGRALSYLGGEGDEYHTRYGLDANIENGRVSGADAFDLIGNALDNDLRGNAAANLLDGGAGSDVLRGYAGNDTYVVDSRADLIFESASEGFDTVKASSSGYVLTANVESLEYVGDPARGFEGFGNASRNDISGGAGNDWLDGGAGADSLSGYGGNDTYYVDSVYDRAFEAAGEGTDTVRARVAAYTLGDNVENLVNDGPASQLFLGTGNALANTLVGGDGRDGLDGMEGADRMQGGKGDDAYFVDNASDRVVELSGEGDDRVVTSLTSYTLGANVEDLSFDNSGLHILFGGGGSGNMGPADPNFRGIGNALDNDIGGGSGNDVLDGRAGADAMQGGSGDDRYYVDDARDVVREYAEVGTDSVYASLDYTLANGEQIEVLRANAGSTGLHLTGNDWNNVVVGGAGDDTLDGGRSGTDRLSGGAGGDTYLIDRAGTVVSEAAGQGIDTVKASCGFVLRANVENLSLAADAGAIDGTGNDLANVLTGNGAANALRGGAGADTLIGAAGIDNLTGGTGADTFVFRSLADSSVGSRDAIRDFSHAEGDRIDLSGITTAASDGGFHFAEGATGFHRQAGELIVTEKAGTMVVQGDANGDGRADLIINAVTGGGALHEGDFLLL